MVEGKSNLNLAMFTMNDYEFSLFIKGKKLTVEAEIALQILQIKSLFTMCADILFLLFKLIFLIKKQQNILMFKRNNLFILCISSLYEFIYL